MQRDDPVALAAVTAGHVKYVTYNCHIKRQQPVDPRLLPNLGFFGDFNVTIRQMEGEP